LIVKQKKNTTITSQGKKGGGVLGGPFNYLLHDVGKKEELPLFFEGEKGKGGGGRVRNSRRQEGKEKGDGLPLTEKRGKKKHRNGTR